MAERKSTSQKIATNVTSSGLSGVTSGLLTTSKNLNLTQSVASLISSTVTGTNILDGYDNVTYHVTWSIVYEGTEIIIVESGKTDLIIDSFEIDSTIGPTFRNKNIGVAQMRMVLREAVGVSLFDKLFYVQSLLSMDMKTITYKITLSFKGYNPTTGKIVNVIGNKFTWTTMLTDLTFKIDESGSIYNLSFVSIANTAFSDELGTIQFGGSVTKTSGSLGDILNSLATQMNNQVLNDNGIQRVSYKFKDIPYSTLGVTLPVDCKSPFDLTILSADKNNRLTASARNNDVSHMTKGTQVSKYLDMLLSNSSDVASLLLGIKSPSSDSMFGDNNNTYTVHHIITATVTYDLFVPELNDYMKTVTYTVIPKLTHVPVQSTKQVDTTDNVFLTWSKDKVKSVMKNSVINRKYEYIFTGENTEVFNFDIKGNMPFALNFPSSFGKNTVISTVTSGQVKSKVMAQNQVSAAASLQQATNKLNSDSLSYYNNGKASDFLSNIQNSNNYVLDYYTQKAISSNILASATNKRKSNAQKLATVTSKSKYLDDMTNSNGTYDNIYVPIQITSQQNDQQYGGAVERDPDGNESIFSTIMNQIYGVGVGDMTNLNISIRYDPYWLGTTEGLTDDQVGKQGTSSTVNLSYDTEGSYCNYDIRDMAMIFNFNVPTGMSEKTGTPILKKDNMFTGIYIINTVRHKFGAGQMTQELEGVRMMTMPMSAILKGD